MKTLTILVVLSVVHLGSCFPSYRDLLPNGNEVTDCDGNVVGPFGHVNGIAGGPRNQFGIDFLQEGIKWTTALCEKDSDQDGITNGEELGDPSCEWTPENPTELNEVVGHPGLNCGAVSYSINRLLSRFQKPPDPTPKVPAFALAHGILMLIAWVLFAPAGILLAMCNKTKTNPKVAMWFQLHQALLATTVVLTLIAFIIIANAGQFRLYDAHTRIGFAVVILAVVQPIGGLLRVHKPVKGSKKSLARIVWEYFHQWLGRSLLTLAIAASFLGLQKIGINFDALRITNGIGYTIIALFILGSIASFMYVLLIRKDEAKCETADDFNKQKDPDVEYGNRKEMEQGTSGKGPQKQEENSGEAQKSMTMN